MSDNDVSLGKALSNMFHAVVSLFTTGSWKAEEMADGARSTDALLDRIPEAAEQDAQRVLDSVNDALTSFGLLDARYKAAESNVERWEGIVTSAAAKFNTCPAEDTARKAQLESLLKSAIKERKKAEAARDMLKTAVDESATAKEEALEAAEKAGVRREAALSQTETLRIQDLTAEAKRNLSAAAIDGSAAEATKLLDEANRKVLEHVAQAEAAKQIASVLPKSADDVAADIERTSLDDDVDAEFAELTKIAG